MSPEDGLRFLAYQASYAQTCEEFQATLLLLPAILRVTRTKPMHSYEAMAFKREMLETLIDQPFQPVSLKEGRAG